MEKKENFDWQEFMLGGKYEKFSQWLFAKRWYILLLCAMFSIFTIFAVISGFYLFSLFTAACGAIAFGLTKREWNKKWERIRAEEAKKNDTKS